MISASPLKIAEPCHENWQDMTPQEQGRHCDKCCKVVVDFTTMSTEKVISFIQERKAEKICGRFRAEQVHTAEKNVRTPKPYRLFFAALYLVFGGMLFTSCHTSSDKNVMGKVAMEKSYGNESSNFNSVDSPMNQTIMHVDPIKRSKGGAVKPTCKIDTTEPEVIKMGEVMYVPNDSLK